MDDLLKLIAIRQKLANILYQHQQKDDCVTDWDWVFLTEGVDDDWLLKGDIPMYTIAEPTYSIN